MKAGIQSKEEFKTKLEESVKREKSLDAVLKTAKVENKRLERRNDDLTETKEKLQKRNIQPVEVKNF